LKELVAGLSYSQRGGKEKKDPQLGKSYKKNIRNHWGKTKAKPRGINNRKKKTLRAGVKAFLVGFQEKVS